MLAAHVPTPTTSFVGRGEELAEIAKLLANPGCRLLTLVGPGGIGKTRLALQSAADELPHFEHGVYFVPLVGVGSPDLIAPAIANALPVGLYGAENLCDQVIHYLRKKQMLLLLDNFEHLLAGVNLLTEMLQAAPGVKLLVTSRERLNIQEEWVFVLEGLSFPKEQATNPLESYSAVELFIERARQVQTKFILYPEVEAVKTICQQVEGMPLGLELAASWLRVMTCQQIAVHMESSLDFLTTPLRNVPERHRSLRAMFEQSWRLLSADEQAVLMKLTVFRGGFDLEAAEAVAGAALPLLASLVDKSLIQLSTPDRYDLHELLRQFAADKLAELGELAAVINRRHLEFYANLAAEAEVHLYGPQKEAWFDRLEVEHDNLRAAMAWTLRDKEAEAGLRLAGALGFFWEHRAYHHEGGEWLEKLLSIASDVPAATRAKALRVAGSLAGGLGNDDLGRTYCEESLRLARELGDKLSIAWAVGNLGNLPFEAEGYNPLSQVRLEEALALFREIGDGFGISHMLRRLAALLGTLGNYAGARRLAEEALALAREAKDKNAAAWALAIVARGSWLQSHDPEQTLPLVEESLSLAQEIGDKSLVAQALFFRGQATQTQGNYECAHTCYADSLAIFREMGVNNLYIANDLVGFAELAELQGRPVRAARLLGAAAALTQSRHSMLPLGGEVERDVPALRTQLGKTAFASAWTEGKAMAGEQVVAYALENVSSTEEAKQTTVVTKQPLDEPLTVREREVLCRLAAGASNRQIAQALGVTVGTIKTYTHRIYQKLDVESRVQAVSRAHFLNLI